MRIILHCSRVIRSPDATPRASPACLRCRASIRRTAASMCWRSTHPMYRSTCRYRPRSDR
ncbi:MAG: hypothetical protein EBV76_09670 [Gammaproteobacteria bacterium]|nr:hypothetical protein [Gammaproteobacteria bacterium]